MHNRALQLTHPSARPASGNIGQRSPDRDTPVPDADSAGNKTGNHHPARQLSIIKKKTMSINHSRH